MLFGGDCQDVLKTYEANSFDALVTDPPYFLTGNGGKGFMGKEWDSLSPKNAIADVAFRHMHVISQREKDDSAHELVITKAEALALCSVFALNHITDLARLHETVRFVLPPSFIETISRDTVPLVAGILLDEPKWLAQITHSTFTEKTQNGKNSTEVQNGTGFEKKSTKETNGFVNAAQSTVKDPTFNVTTSSFIDLQKIIQKLISSPSVKAAIRQSMNVPNFIPVLSEVFHRRWAREVIRVLKPGAHGLVFGGTRVFHRLTSALEEEGFEIRDVCQWLYGSGFPKSLAIDKAMRKEGIAGAEKWTGFGTALKPAWEPIILIRKPCSEKTVAKNVEKWGVGGINIDASRIVLKTGDKKSEGGANAHLSGTEFFGEMKNAGNNRDGLGRYPSNLILDEDAAKMLDEQSGLVRSAGAKSISIQNNSSTDLKFNGKALGIPGINTYSDSGGASRFFYVAKASKKDRNAGLEGMPEIESGIGDERPSGQSMSRLDGRDPRKSANHHPCVKSSKLMEYLCTLITPPKGKIIDPFMGSGSTGVAAKRLGFEFTGIEQNEEYLEIAKKRIDANIATGIAKSNLKG